MTEGDKQERDSVVEMEEVVWVTGRVAYSKSAVVFQIQFHFSLTIFSLFIKWL